MRVDKIQFGKSHKSNAASMARAGVLGSVGGVLVRNFAPLTTQEHDKFFNESAKAAIQNNAAKARAKEAESIMGEIADGRLLISQEAKDIFTSSSSTLAKTPKKAAEYLKDASEGAKKEVDNLLSRIVSVGAAREHTELNNIKNAAKADRPLGYFIAIGALLAMSTQLIVNAFKSALPKEEPKKAEQKHDLTMADVLLDGLGSNTEVLFLASESKKNK